MKKLIAMLAAATFLLTACNSMKPKEDDEPNTVTEQTKTNVNRSLNGVDNNNINNGVNPNEIESHNTKVMYNGDEVLLSDLDNVIDDQLEKSNAGINFKVVIVAEEDNTQ
jgi:PBP1b-binding outer membrane lipoprotein LpoB